MSVSNPTGDLADLEQVEDIESFRARARSWIPAIASSESSAAARLFSRFCVVFETVVLSVQIATGTPTSRNW